MMLKKKSKQLMVYKGFYEAALSVYLRIIVFFSFLLLLPRLDEGSRILFPSCNIPVRSLPNCRLRISHRNSPQ